MNGPGSDGRPTTDTLPHLDGLDLVVFDMAGTVVDHGCRAPFEAFRAAFRAYGLDVDEETLAAPMGQNKRDHIRAVLEVPEVARAWERMHRRAPGPGDVEALYTEFLPLQERLAVEYAVPIEGARATTEALRAAGVRVVWTTGYPRSVARPLLDALDFGPDASFTSDEVERGRPAPDLIRAAMAHAGTNDPRRVVKIGDTVADAEAATAAGAWAVAVTDTSSLVGLDAAAWNALAEADREVHRSRVRAQLAGTRVHAFLPSVADLPTALRAGAKA